MSFTQLFLANFRMLYRNWRGLFWNIALPVGLYAILSLIKFGGNFAGGAYSRFLLPGIIAMTLMQTGIFSLAYWLIDLKERGVLKRFRVTPLSNSELVSALISTRLVVMLVQIILLSAIGVWFFGAHVYGSIVAIIIISIIGGSIFLSLGFFVSTVANTYDEAAPITTVINLIFTFLGNIFFQTDAFPKILNEIGQKLPITYLANGLRHNFMEQWTLKQSLHDIFGLLVWLVIILAITIYSFQKNSEQ